MNARRSRARRAAAAAWLAGTQAALACGQCDEDRMAATYDHAVVQEAASQRRTVVFCEVKGALDMASLQAAARAVSGIDAATLRLSAEPAALSFVVDPQVRQPASAVAELQRALGASATLRRLRVTLP